MELCHRTKFSELIPREQSWQFPLLTSKNTIDEYINGDTKTDFTFLSRIEQAADFIAL